MQHDNPWQHLNSLTVYEDTWVVVKKDNVIRPDAKKGTYTYIESRDSVMIVAVNDKDEIYLEWTYRYPVKSWGWELPGGGVDKNEPLESAKIELAEEAGFTGDKWGYLGKSSTYNGLVTGATHYFTSKDLQAVIRPSSDDFEITNTGRFFKLDAINEMILNSEVNDSQTIAGIHLLTLFTV